ncbi:MAG: hypothetical protein IKZ45_00655 [Fibrobacter sp.]|nr:hypothetical protein [Fibrobacter sp.]
MKFSMMLTTLSIVAFSVMANAAIDPEMEGMEPVSRGDGTFLIGGPTYHFDRILGAGGIHSESELWTPAKLRDRLLFNRMSALPSWTPMEPSVWIKTGNELGDMIYQDVITAEDRPANRTPILEGGFRTPSIKGFWATVRGFQDDHYSSRTSSFRRKEVSDEFALFGENYPMFSSIYGGLGFTNDVINTSVLAGEEYIWEYAESSRWIPVHMAPRVEARADFWNFALTAAFEKAEYQNDKFKESGERTEVNGSVLYKCSESCQKGVFQMSAGMAFRFVSDDGDVYTGLDNDRVLWPFMQLRVKPLRWLYADAMFGMNDSDWLVQDSIEMNSPFPVKGMGVTIGVKNISGTRLNPLADDVEYFSILNKKDTIDLAPSGQMNLVQAYLAFADTVASVSLGGRATFWAEHGAETFHKEGVVELSGMDFRFGDVSRINSWIKGITGELWLDAWLEDMFKFRALAGFERIDGPTERFEVTPSEFFVAFTGDWLIRKSFRVSHSLRYRSDAQWNLRGHDPLVVKGDWYWDATFEQQFLRHGLYLTGTIIHVLADEVVQVPNGDYDRLRFVCTVKKTF